MITTLGALLPGAAPRSHHQRRPTIHQSTRLLARKALQMNLSKVKTCWVLELSSRTTRTHLLCHLLRRHVTALT